MKASMAVLLGCLLGMACSKATSVDALDGAPALAVDSGFAADGGGGGSAAASSSAPGSESAAASPSASGASGSASAVASGSAAAAGSGSAAASGSATAGSGAGAGSEPGTAATAKDGAAAQPGAPAGVVEFLSIVASGGTTDASMKAALEKSKQRYRGCYGKALASDPSTQGTLKLRATIASDGLVEKVDVIGGNLGLSPLVQCSVAATKALKVSGAAAPATKVTFDVSFRK